MAGWMIVRAIIVTSRAIINGVSPVE